MALLRLNTIIFRRRNMQEWHGKRSYLIGQIWMVGNHHHDRHVELAAAIAPQQIEQAVVFRGCHDCDAFRFGSLSQPEIHVEPRGDLFTEIAFEGVARGGEPWQVENGPLHERAAGLLSGVLVQRDDIGARVGEERTYRRHQARSIGTAQQ